MRGRDDDGRDLLRDADDRDRMQETDDRGRMQETDDRGRMQHADNRDRRRDAEVRHADEQQAIDWLTSDDSGAASGYASSGAGAGSRRAVARPDDEVVSRYERDAYSGRRSTRGPQRSISLGEDRVRRDDAGSLDAPKAGRRAERLRRAERPRKPGSVRRKVTAVIVCLLVLIGVWLGYLNHNMQLHDSALNAACTGISTPFKPYYVLITGSDAREDEASRTDTILLARIDPRNKLVTLISIPRDTRVYLGDEYGYGKINAAHAYGGPALTVSVVSQFAGVKIAHYFEVGFDGFASIVDAVGGVTVDVPADTTVDDVTLPEGVQTLDGEQALVFVRCRKTYANGDFQRAANQRAFMVALASAIKHAPFYRIPFILTSVSKCVTTDRSIFGVIGMMIEVQGIDSDAILTGAVPSSTDTIDGVSYVITDEDAWATMMSRVDAGLSPE